MAADTATPRVSDYMTREVVTVSPDDTVASVARRVAESDEEHSGFPVCDGRRCEGFVTARDLLLADDNAAVFTVMSEELVVAHPEMDLDDAARVILRSGIQKLPVVDDAGNRGLLGLASEMNELVEKARERSIAREEMQGGTFTITNCGAVGGEYATPIINYPETAILGLGEIKKRPAVRDGKVVPGDVMTLSLSIDHRIIDGAVAAEFANQVLEYLNNPNLLLLE